MERTISWYTIAGVLALMAFQAVFAQRYVYQSADQAHRYEYTITPTGENFTFEFLENPGVVEARLRAVMDVFSSVYGDVSIPAKHSYFYMKEGAKCFVFDATLYSYQACFLPNEYSPGNQNRFWGYVTRIPNGLWLFTYNILPGVIGLGAAVYFLFRR